MDNWKERTEMLVGEAVMNRFEQAVVAVIGVGGVGGYAAEMIVRAGVGNLIILDSDTVSQTNRNRQLIALSSTVGRPKCEVLAERLMDINPELNLTVIPTYLESSLSAASDKSTDPSLLSASDSPADSFRLTDSFKPATPQSLLAGRRIDFLVDAIDTLAPKLSLIKYCMDSGIPIVSSMGAGAKYDVTKIRIADISKSFNCPLAYIVRKRLRHLGISKGFKVVFSEELPDRDAMVPCEDRNKKSQVGTISYIPAVFGCACAQVALQHLSKIG